VFDLQDKVALSVAGVIEPALQAAETTRSAGRPTTDLTAYDLYLRACAIFLSSAKQIPEALRLLQQAIERDPGFGPRTRPGRCLPLSLFRRRLER
jgi:adenylate cyclase